MSAVRCDFERRYVVAIVSVVILSITYLHYSTLPSIYPYHNVYKEFYYVPIFLSALAFGLRGSILVYLFVFVFEIPFIVFGWTGTFASELSRLMHLGLQAIFAVFSGYLIERERKTRKELEKERDLARIGQVAAAIIHDLKNPLVTIMGFSRRIKEKKGNIDESVDIVMDSALTMQKIVRDVLDFSKPLALALKQEDIREVVARACQYCGAKASEAGVNLVKDFPASPVNVELDSFHMERAFVNLISNAVEASAIGQNVKVVITPAKNNLVITIADRGPGMDRETIENIFTPFYTKKREGTGLGMPIAKKVIEAHKGTISILSQPGKGTEVSVSLSYEVQ